MNVVRGSHSSTYFLQYLVELVATLSAAILLSMPNELIGISHDGGLQLPTSSQWRELVKQLYVMFSQYTQVAMFTGLTWGPPIAARTQVGPMLASRTLISGNSLRNPGRGQLNDSCRQDNVNTFPIKWIYSMKYDEAETLGQPTIIFRI